MLPTSIFLGIPGQDVIFTVVEKGLPQVESRWKEPGKGTLGRETIGFKQMGMGQNPGT